MSVAMTMQLKTKKLGVLLRSARQNSGQTPEESAQLLGVSATDMEAFELGEKAPALPQLEILAYHWGIPVEYFWENELKTETEAPAQPLDQELVLGLRQRIIGAMLRKARLERRMGLDELSVAAGTAPEQLSAYELGLKAVPLPELEALAEKLGSSVKQFRDQHGPLGLHFNQKKALEDFQDLPVELQIFAAQPVNRPFLELAQRLSEMDVRRLRSIAEGLLEITF